MAKINNTMNKITLNMNTFMKPLSVFGLLLCSFVGTSQEVLDFVPEVYTPTEPACVFYEGEFNGFISIPRSQNVIQKMQGGGTACSTFIVTYNGFESFPEAQTAFQFAVDIWSMSIESSQPIRVDATFAALSPGVLGSAGSNSAFTSNHPDAIPNVFYARALWEKIEDMESDTFGGVTIDINANFSSTANWYFGLDANPPGNQTDFVSVVLHELGHGLGFFGGASVDGAGEGEIRFNNIPIVYDTFIQNGTGDAILSFTDPSIALGDQLTGNDLFNISAISTGQNGGVAPKLYLPTSWNQGSSYSHWDESTFNGTINSLMTFAIGQGEANHNPGPMTLGFFEDMGWSICGGSLTVEEFDLAGIEVSPNPFMSSITVKLANNFSDDYTLDLIDINGRVILSEGKTASNGSLTLSNLDNLTSALYFMKLTNVGNGQSITKKIVKK